MADYDSDSSDGEFAETNVLLGYASKDADEDTISRIGGRPEWLDADKSPSAALARCKICKNLMVMLLQLNGELPERFPNHDRRIYVFACRRSSCSRREGSIRAIRGVRVWADDGSAAAAAEEKKRQKEEEAKKQEKAKEAEKAKPRLGDALFGGGPSAAGAGGAKNPFSSNANPFSSSSSGSNPFGANPFSSQPASSTATPALTTTTTTTTTKETEKDLPKTFAETLSINAPKTAAVRPPAPEPWPATDQQPTPYPTLYLADADYETLEPEPADMPLPANARIEEADAPDTTSAADKEAFESTMDTTFQKFADRLAQNPEQVIRYEFGGAPLLCSKTDAIGRAAAGGAMMPRCASCGGKRTFEVQLTPHAIAELEAEDLSLEGMEWGTIIVGVCERDCVPAYLEEEEAGYLEEWAGVQWEEEGGKK
ncbi:PDCD2 domain protein [Akanthomyces lecanii RCEF 1005]|uniref:PDCD2 domain protein n=1 Tax=Akanthomyces lecanii RCEF 1005 TaxID=1081108 RepID=A0A168KQD5_CORDF|nr:PDCD2 domain protein [Akanthomyces lecanii RCEF 1005]